MSALLFSMALAALICGAMWTRPGVRAAAGGAWRAGWDQACREFRQGYEWAQARLRAGNPTPRDFRWWVSAVLATVYGACKVCGAAGRVGHAAWQGGRDSYRRWKESRPVDAEVVNEGENPAPTAAAAGRADTTTADTTAGSTGSAATGGAAPRPATAPTSGPAPDPAGPAPSSTTYAEPTIPTLPDPIPALPPGTGSTVTTKEDLTMQTEATGLTSYASAFDDLAADLGQKTTAIDALVASMQDVLAQHSDLVAPTAHIQDLLNQAAAVAGQIAELARKVAAN